MQQFDVFANRSTRSRDRAPYLLVLPFRYFLDRRTTVIAPLIDAKLLTPVPKLNPVFQIDGHQVVFSPMEVVNIPTGELQSFVLNLASERENIIGALDLLFTGI